MNHHISDSSVHGDVQARILDWIAISFSRESSWTGDDENSLFGRSWGGAGQSMCSSCSQASQQPWRVPPLAYISPARDPGDPPGPADFCTSLALFSASLAPAPGNLPFLPGWPALQTQEDLAFRDYQSQTAICPGKGSDPFRAS